MKIQHEMPRFWKIVREDDGIFDIVAAYTVEHASRSKRGVFRAWQIVETTESDWRSWRTVNWREVDRLENDMISMDGF